jgi:hypothetical protein
MADLMRDVAAGNDIAVVVSVQSVRDLLRQEIANAPPLPGPLEGLKLTSCARRLTISSLFVSPPIGPFCETYFHRCSPHVLCSRSNELVRLRHVGLVGRRLYNADRGLIRQFGVSPTLAPAVGGLGVGTRLTPHQTSESKNLCLCLAFRAENTDKYALMGVFAAWLLDSPTVRPSEAM